MIPFDLALAELKKVNNKCMWKLIIEESPPENKVIKTKIDDDKGVRNEQELIFVGKLWWAPDRKMYVYYTPTHWWKSTTV